MLHTSSFRPFELCQNGYVSSFLYSIARQMRLSFYFGVLSAVLFCVKMIWLLCQEEFVDIGNPLSQTIEHFYDKITAGGMFIVLLSMLMVRNNNLASPFNNSQFHLQRNESGLFGNGG